MHEPLGLTDVLEGHTVARRFTTQYQLPPGSPVPGQHHRPRPPSRQSCVHQGVACATPGRLCCRQGWPPAAVAWKEVLLLHCVPMPLGDIARWCFADGRLACRQLHSRSWSGCMVSCGCLLHAAASWQSRSWICHHAQRCAADACAAALQSSSPPVLLATLLTCFQHVAASAAAPRPRLPAQTTLQPGGGRGGRGAPAARRPGGPSAQAAAAPGRTAQPRRPAHRAACWLRHGSAMAARVCAAVWLDLLPHLLLLHRMIAWAATRAAAPSKSRAGLTMAAPASGLEPSHGGQRGVRPNNESLVQVSSSICHARKQ